MPAEEWPGAPAGACPPLPFRLCCQRVAPLPLQAYYGLSLAMNDLAGSVYLNQFLGFVVEFPAYLLVILVIDRLGRRFAISWSMLIGECPSHVQAWQTGWQVAITINCGNS